MIIPIQMQKAMHDQKAQLTIIGMTQKLSLLANFINRDEQIAEIFWDLGSQLWIQ